MAGKPRLDMLEARAERVLAQHRPDPLRDAIEALPDDELTRLVALGRSDPAAFQRALTELTPDAQE